jgi:hypothetical protein
MKSDVVMVQPKLKVYSVEIFYIVLGLIILLVMLDYLPKGGIYLFQIFDFKNEFVKRMAAPLLRYKLTYGFLESAIYSSFLVLVGMLSFFWLKVKTTTISLSNKYMVFSYGVMAREEDNIDLVDIRDQSLYRSQLHIISNDKTNPDLFLLLTNEDAHKVFDFIQIYATRSIVDYRMSQDLRNSKDKIGGTYAMVDDKADHEAPEEQPAKPEPTDET